VSRRTTEVGPRISDFVTTVFDLRAGIRGDITDTIHFDVSGAHGESENNQTQRNYVLTSRARAAAFATNTTTCLPGAPNGSTAAGCVPVNFFGAAGSITPNQIPFLTADAGTSSRVQLSQARAIITGDFGLSSPFATDAINFAAGGEFRRYTAQNRNDVLSQTAGELGGAGGAAPNITGGYDVYEAIGELNVPLVQDRPLFDSLSLEAGVRYSHYTVFAPSSPHYNTTTYKIGGTWAPVKDIKFRGNYAHAVRAPNISELFSPQVVGLVSNGVDPCASLTNAGAPIPGRGNPTGDLRAICLAQGAPVSNINFIQLPTAGQSNATSGGNLNLKPETSNSYTFGTVITPQFVRGLSLTVDYYHIKVRKAITVPNVADALNACFGSITPASATSPACTQIRRNPATGGLDGDPATTGGIFLALSNQGSLETDGIDAALNYRRDLGFAKFNLAATGNYTFHSKFNANAGSPTSLNRECTGFYSTNCGTSAGSIQPKWQTSVRATFGFDDVDLSVLWRHIDSENQEPDDIVNGNGPACGPGNQAGGCAGKNFQHIPAFNYFDLSTRIGVTSNVDFTLTVSNLLDKKPPIVGTNVGAVSFNSGNTYPSTYDALGRLYAASVKLKF
ncbi:MAG: TonB-dependent receptor, partial [Sphingomonadaceae bacterium]|nr:TonB-dependent receptor [Sphingomonadaceae bacterium]